MYRFIYQFLGIVYFFFFKFRWIKAIKLHNKKSDLIVWMWPNYPHQPFEYFGRSIIVSELANLYAVVNAGMPYRLIIGRKIGKVKNSNIIYQVSHEFMNIFKFIHYPPFLLGTVKALESQNNNLFLSSAELEYWENKDFMHEKFKELDISHPKSFVENTKNLAVFNSLPYPFIIKEVNSQGSKGLHKIENSETLLSIAKDLAIKGEQHVIVQQIVNMTKDLRVTIIGEEVVLAYWRINPPNTEWRPTSTTHGSTVDFGNFPEHWKSYFIEITKRMKLTAAAYDVCWEHDDVQTQPMILEVSPSFQPNPNLPEYLSHVPFKDYKKIVFTKQPFFKERINTVIKMAELKLKFYKTAGLLKINNTEN